MSEGQGEAGKHYLHLTYTRADEVNRHLREEIAQVKLAIEAEAGLTVGEPQGAAR